MGDDVAVSAGRVEGGGGMPRTARLSSTAALGDRNRLVLPLLDRTVESKSRRSPSLARGPPADGSSFPELEPTSGASGRTARTGVVRGGFGLRSRLIRGRASSIEGCCRPSQPLRAEPIANSVERRRWLVACGDPSTSTLYARAIVAARTRYCGPSPSHQLRGRHGWPRSNRSQNSPIM